MATLFLSLWIAVGVVVTHTEAVCLPNGTVIVGTTELRVASPGDVVATECGRTLTELAELAATVSVVGSRLRDVDDVTAPLRGEARVGYGAVVERDGGVNATYRVRVRPALPQRSAVPTDTGLATTTLLAPAVGTPGRVELVRTTHGLYGEAWVLWVRAYEREVAFSLHRCLSHRCHEAPAVYTHAETLADANGQFVGAELLLVDTTVWVMWMHSSTSGPTGPTLKTVRCESETTCATPVTTAVSFAGVCDEVQQAGVVQDALSVVRNTASELMVLFGCPLSSTSRPGVVAFFCPVASTCATGSVVTVVHAPTAALAPPEGTDVVWLEATINVDTSTPELYWSMWQRATSRSQLFLVRCTESDCATAAHTVAKLAGDDTFSTEKVAPFAIAHAESGALLAAFARTNFVLSGSDSTPGVADVQLFACTSLDPATDATLGQNVVGFDAGAYNGLYTRDAAGTHPQVYGVFALRRDRLGRPVLLYNDQQNVLRMRVLATANGDDATVDELIEVGVSPLAATDADEPVLAADLGANVDGEPLVFYSRVLSNATATVALRVVHGVQPHLFVD